MTKLCIPLVFCCIIVIALPLSTPQGVDLDPTAVQQWFQALPHAQTKLTKLHFYFHDKINGKQSTTVQVAQSNTTTTSPTVFGAVYVMDDPLTIGPGLNSKVIGRAHGIYVSTSHQEFGLLFNLNFVFTDGKYKGSTLSVLGHNAISHKHRELPITGGSGLFRLARGIATAKTNFFNVTINKAIIEFNLMVMHYI